MTRTSTATKARSDKDWLTDWLDLSKYESSKDFGLFLWGQQLRARAQLQESWDVPFAEQLYAELKDAPLNLGFHDAALYLRKPVQDMSHLDLAQQNALCRLDGVSGVISEWNDSYANLSTADRILRTFFVARKNEGESDDVQEENNSDGNDKIWPWLHPLTGVQAHPLLVSFLSSEDMSDSAMQQFAAGVLGVAFVGVDLSYGDTALKRSFERWLSARRTAMTEARISAFSQPTSKQSAMKLTSAAREHWRTLKVLPYIDIRLRAKFESRKMPTSDTIGEYLFGANGSPGEKVRQKVAPLSKKLLGKAVFWRLISEGVGAHYPGGANL